MSPMTIMTRTPDDAPNGSEPTEWASLHAGLHRFALALCRNRDEADDLVQQTLLRLIARGRSAGPAAYARKALLRLWLDRQRSLRRRAARLARIAAGWTGTESPRSPPPPEHREQHARALALIETLPARQRAALVLRLVEGLDYQQIAAALGCSPDAVRASLHLARRKLRRALGEET